MNNEEMKQWINANLITKQEAMEITGQGLSAFNQAISTGQLMPFYDHGNDRSRVRLYLKSDVEDYARGASERRKRLQK